MSGPVGVRAGGGSVCLAQASSRRWEELDALSDHEKLTFSGRKGGRTEVHLILPRLLWTARGVSHGWDSEGQFVFLISSKY